MIYVLLDGVGDLPHPDLDGKTPLEAANTPTLDKIASNGTIGEVISVGKGIAPESDIAVFNMLGYKFKHADYAGRGVIEAIGVGIDFKDGDLALRGNYSTLNNEEIIIDRRAFVTSGLISLGVALFILTKDSGITVTHVTALSFLAVGVIVLALGTGWQNLRKVIVTKLPDNWQNALPPIN